MTGATLYVSHETANRALTTRLVNTSIWLGVFLSGFAGLPTFNRGNSLFNGLDGGVTYPAIDVSRVAPLKCHRQLFGGLEHE